MHHELAESFVKGQSRLGVEYDPAAENVVGDLQPERAIALQLRFSEPLVGRRLVRKIGVRPRVAPDSGAGFGAVISRLDIENIAILGLGAVVIGAAIGG